MVHDSGYVSKEDIYSAYISATRDDEIYSKDKHGSYCDKNVLLYELSLANCEQVLGSIKNREVNRIIVIGDDASIIFDTYLKSIKSDVKWISVLASSQFNRLVPKFWISQSQEVSLVVNELRHYNNISIISTGENSKFTRNLEQQIGKTLKNRYDKDVLYDCCFGDAVFIAGLGDKKHITVVNDCIGGGKSVFTNNAVLDCAKELHGEVRCVDLLHANRFKIKLQAFYLQLAFELFLINTQEKLLNDVLYTELLNFPVHFDQEGYISLPLCLADAQCWEDRYNYYSYPNSRNFDSMWNIYNISKVIATIQTTNIDSLLLNKVDYLSYLVHHKGRSNRYEILTHESKDKLYTVSTIADKIFTESLRSGILAPIQINLEEEDPIDNDTWRLCIEVNGILRYPILLPENYAGAKVCLSTSLNGEKRYYLNNICLKDIKGACKISYIYIIPYLNSSLENQIYSFALILTNTRLNYIDLKLLSSFIQPSLMEKHKDLLADDINKNAIKSAKAAIMSRNMSHNLGSHVMFYIKQKLQSVSKIVDSDVLHNILPGNISDLQEIQKQIAEKKGIELPFLVGLGRFINYLQERQDYIATVATDYIPANSTISFKDFIYDELKPDLRYKRHHPEGSSSDAGWQPENLLLDYIAYSEGYDNSNKIQISFEGFDGMNSAENHDFDKLRKFNIAVPGGVIGRQAVFSIMENIIRNAAKHSMRRDDNKISLTFSPLDSIEKLCALNQNGSIFRTKRNEDVGIESGELLIEKYKNAMDDYHILEIRLNMLNRYNDIDELVQKLGESYVDSAGIMKDSSKGLKEMRISAAWLRGYSIDSNIDSTLPPALSVRTIPCCYDKVMFSYIICLPKPKKVAFILDDIEGFESINDLLITCGCRLFKFEENLQIHGYDLVCLGLSEETHIREITSRVSSRVIANPDVVAEFIKSIKSADTDEIKTKIDGIYDSWFNLWYEKAYTSPKPKLTILDNKACDKNQTYVKDFYKDINLTTTGNISDRVCDNSVVYSTHYSGISNLSEDLVRKYSKALAVESITGNNSTDRLIRQDEWNREWYNKHLHAGIVKVGIFDERIYSTFVISKSSINKGNFFIDCESLKTGELKVMDFAKKYNVGVNTAINMKNYTSEELQNFLASKKSYDVRVAQMNRERRVWAMDLIVESDKLIIKGFNTDTNDCVGISESLSNKDAEVDIAVIKKAGEGFEIQSLLENNPYYQAFDIISIHQGILDKIYTALGIKDNEDDKYKITHDLHEFFVKSQTPKNEKEYLPYFVIHSGRSKPNRNDMPQKQPFIQFAAIDHAVKDCKYTLVELLTSAYNESDSNN